METNEETAVGVAPEILVEEVNKVVKEVLRNTSKYRNLARLRADLKLPIYRIPSPRTACFYAVDSSYSSPSIELAGGYLGIVQVAEILMGETCGSPPAVRAYIEYHPTRDLTSIKARYYEREHLVKALERKKRGELPFDVVLVDGEVLYRGGLEDPEGITREEKLVADYTTDLTVKALEIADELDIPVVGVLKRSYSRDVSILNGLADVNLSDRLLLTMVLKPGQYYVLGSYSEIYGQYQRVLSELRSTEREDAFEQARLAKSRFYWLDQKIMSRYGKVSQRVLVIFYKPSNPPDALAVKVEVHPSKSWGMEDIVALLGAISGNTGFPLPIDYVDELSGIPPGVKSLVYNLLKSMLSSADVELAEMLTKLMNPQKPII